MSDTPETDAMLGNPEYCVIAFARKLERELDEARRELAELKNIREEDRVSFNDLRERSHEAHEDRDKWREIAEGLAKHARHSLNCPARIAFDHSHHLACTCGMAEAMRRFEEAGR